MSTDQNRRDFLGTAACAGCCALLSSLTAPARGAESAGEKKAHDFDKLAYCCYECDRKRCSLLEASLTDDLEAKRKRAAFWREKLGREFTPAEVFCFGCKAEPERLGFNVKSCDVRQCVLEKKLISCAHCRALTDCSRKLWVDYPKFREQVLAIQKDVLG